MKYISYIFFCVFLLFSSCRGDKQKITPALVVNPMSASSDYKVNVPVIEIKKDIFDFGDILQGKLVAHEFIISNIGDEKLLISSAKGSCGCTIPDWPRDPIFPGEDAVVKVTFNSSGRQGKQKKTVTLRTNAIPSVKVITIHGNVIIPKKNKDI